MSTPSPDAITHSRAAAPDPADPPQALGDHLDWSRAPRALVIAAIKEVPYAGPFLSYVTSEIWRVEAKTEDLIAASEQRMKDWALAEIARQIDTYDRTLLKRRIEGLRKSLADLAAATDAHHAVERGRWMDLCLGKVQEVQSDLFDTRTPAGAIAVVREVGTIHLALLRDRVVNFEEIFGDQVGTDKPALLAAYRKSLRDNITAYQDFLRGTAVPAAMRQRREAVQSTSTSFTDAAVGLERRAGLKPDVAAQYTEAVVNQLQVTMLAQANDLADAWALFDPDRGQDSFDMDRTVWVGPVGLTRWDLTKNSSVIELNRGHGDADPATAASALWIKPGSVVEFLQFRYGARGGSWGGKGSGGPPLKKVQIPEGVDIVEVQTEWNYVLTRIGLTLSDGTALGPYAGDRPTTVHRASFPDHVLRRVAIHGNDAGIGEMHFGFQPRQGARS